MVGSCYHHLRVDDKAFGLRWFDPNIADYLLYFRVVRALVVVGLPLLLLTI